MHEPIFSSLLEIKNLTKRFDGNCSRIAGIHPEMITKITLRSCRGEAEVFPILEKKQKQQAGSMSGGQERMLELGRAMMLKPKLMLLDEPSAGLAPVVTEGIFQKIKEMNDQGMTLAIVEQNVNIGLEMSDYAYVLELGAKPTQSTSLRCHER